MDDRLSCSLDAKKLRETIDFLNKEFEITIGGVEVYVGLHMHKNQDLKLIYFDQTCYLGPNFVRCTTKDKKDKVFNGVLFCPIFWSPSILMNQNLSNIL
jgi:hypothetical protein